MSTTHRRQGSHLPGTPAPQGSAVRQGHDELVRPAVLPGAGVREVALGEPLDPPVVLAVGRSLGEPVGIVPEVDVVGLVVGRLAGDAELAEEVSDAPHQRLTAAAV